MKKFKYMMYGNFLSFKLNLIWEFYSLLCRLNYKIMSRLNYTEIRNGFINKRYYNLGTFNVDELSNKVELKFENCKVGTDFNISRENNIEISELVFDLLNSNADKIEMCIGSYFQIYWSNVAKYLPGETKNDTSFGWHIDDNPKDILKIFIYLNDTYEENAAFRAFPHSKSNEIINRGFQSDTPEKRINSQSLITEIDLKDLVIFEGKKGTILLFDNNLVHKATAPRKDFRSTVMIEIYPSFKRFNKSNVFNSFSIPITPGEDYPKNPFYNKYNLIK